jgi:uncharacterized protein YndB with AHSA1/START domain
VGRISVSNEIDATPARVWRVIEPIEHHVDWMLDARSIEFDGEQRRGVGTRFVCETRIGPITLHDRMEITDWEPERRLGVRHAGVVTGSGVFELSPIDLDRRTRFTWTEELRFPWYLGGRLGERLGGRWVLAWIWRRNLKALARLVEQS